jgi:hypothetical protein
MPFLRLPWMKRKRLERERAEAEAEFDATTKLSDIKRAAGAAASARAALKELNAAERPGPRANP